MSIKEHVIGIIMLILFVVVLILSLLMIKDLIIYGIL
jgi:hypothetical protein